MEETRDRLEYGSGQNTSPGNAYAVLDWIPWKAREWAKKGEWKDTMDHNISASYSHSDVTGASSVKDLTSAELLSVHYDRFVTIKRICPPPSKLTSFVSVPPQSLGKLTQVIVFQHTMHYAFIYLNGIITIISQSYDCGHCVVYIIIHRV